MHCFFSSEMMIKVTISFYISGTIIFYIALFYTILYIAQQQFDYVSRNTRKKNIWKAQIFAAPFVFFRSQQYLI
jgi:hypothetical protein